MQNLLPFIVFYIFAGLTVISAILVITQSNPVRSVLFLVLAFFASAVLWLLVHAEFLALILVLVYVGAVMTLFLFVVMMLNIDFESQKKHFIPYVILGLIVVTLLVGLLLQVLPVEHFSTGVIESTVPRSTTDPSTAMTNTEALGMVLYTDYAFALELAAVILLVAIVGAITLVHRKAVRSKSQNILQQLMTDRKERVEIIKMKSERAY